MLIDGAPEIMTLAAELQKHFIAVPLVARLCASKTELIGELLAELETPLPHGFAAHDHASRSQQLLDITKAKVEAVIEPNRMSKTVVGKATTFVGWSDSVCFHAQCMTQIASDATDYPEVDNASTTVEDSITGEDVESGLCGIEPPPTPRYLHGSCVKHSRTSGFTPDCQPRAGTRRHADSPFRRWRRVPGVYRVAHG
jgi:hypothetical protein